MTRQDHGASLCDRAGGLRPEPAAQSQPVGAHPSRDEVSAVVAELAAQFGPGPSNGVVAILLHPDLPERFDSELWTDWTFRPAAGAFSWAHNRGLIAPWKLSGKWTFTPLGLALCRHFQGEPS